LHIGLHSVVLMAFLPSFYPSWATKLRYRYFITDRTLCQQMPILAKARLFALFFAYLNNYNSAEDSSP
jgi:hypothetical protein